MKRLWYRLTRSGLSYTQRLEYVTPPKKLVQANVKLNDEARRKAEYAVMAKRLDEFCRIEINVPRQVAVLAVGAFVFSLLVWLPAGSTAMSARSRTGSTFVPQGQVLGAYIERNAGSYQDNAIPSFAALHKAGNQVLLAVGQGTVDVFGYLADRQVEMAGRLDIWSASAADAVTQKVVAINDGVMGSDHQAGRAVAAFFADLKTTYTNTGGILSESLAEQKGQATWAWQGSLDGWKELSVFYKDRLGDMVNIQKNALSEQARQSDQLTHPVWDKLVDDVGLLDRLSRNDFGSPGPQVPNFKLSKQTN